jgi:hypothetical protein
MAWAHPVGDHPPMNDRTGNRTKAAKAHDVSSTYVGMIDADPGAAYAALAALDPMRSLATRLSALGIDDRAIWAESPHALGLVETDGRCELLYSLVWRFGTERQHARLTWRIRLDDDGRGGTRLSIAMQARGSDATSRDRVFAAWPLVETIAIQHAKGLRRAVEDYADDPAELEAPRLRAVG